MSINQNGDKFRMLIIDDQESIHNDFKKIFTSSKTNEEIDDLADMILGNTNDIHSNNVENKEDQKKEYILDSAFQGQEGYEKVKEMVEAGTHYQVAFVDMRMPPGWDGLTTIKRIWQVDHNIQIIICTAYSDTPYEVIIKEFKHNSNLLILKKPFDKIEVDQLASNLTEKWMLSKFAEMKMKTLEEMVESRTKKIELKCDELKAEICFRRKIEKENEKMHAEMFQISKLAAIGGLAAGVAHEINNPLTIIKGYLSIMQKSIGKNNLNVDAFLTLISKQYDAVKRIQNIVNGLRIISRKDSDDEKYFEVNEIFKNILEMVKMLYKNNNVNVEYKDEVGKSFLFGNAGKFQQVIMNLISNASDAITAGGDSSKKGQIIIRSYYNTADRSSICIDISDNGCGMSKEIKEKIFDVFFTTKEVGKGTGLGLSLSMSIITKMKGKINVTSSENQGSTFTIMLPAYSENMVEEVDIKDKNDQNQQLDFKKLDGKVLVVDDDEDIRLVLDNQLKLFNLKVELAENGDRAIELLRNNFYDYVITDIKMPGLSGLELLMEMKKIANYKKIIIISGNVENIYLGNNIQKIIENSDFFVCKPFNIEEIYNALIQNT